MKVAITGKGGVGKTTLSSTLARLYADEGRTVLAADVDPDANLGLALGLTEEEVIRIHSSRDYLIYMLGFLPGFCYLGGLDERIHTPRLQNPRLKIRAGSVGIGGSQTGIYPLDSPGGWQLMGMTPVKTYDPTRAVPILVEAGDYIRFVPIDETEYHRIKELADRGEYQCVIHGGEV